ncbi:flagellar hook assembly protein FlgD [Tatumella sp. UBA2305]|uniref:flagellar hook assembly protein FlgD n=1 Tax=Tatumella sp. UBA2305 TaxID=1947647 RepID=UPI0025E3BD90|nr:flagellar hook assembly protein FlgD [Tatumella sp. UBA2305]
MSISATVDRASNQPVIRENTASNSNGNSAADLQNQFMTLLVAQLKNQDPTNPMDNSALTSQLAQINTLSGIEQLNTTLNSVSGQISAGQSMENTLLIGHGVMVPGNTLLSGKDSSSDDGAMTTTPFGVETPVSISSAVATITDSDGNVVAKLDLGNMDAGVHTFQWDGTGEDGSPAPEGKYTVTISASADDTPVDVTSLSYAQVYGVTPGVNGNPGVLNLGAFGNATLDQIRQIL